MKRNARHLLLPWYVRFPAWFMLVFSPPCVLGGLLFFILDLNGVASAYGLYYSGPMRNPMILVFVAIYVLSGYAAFALLWGRRDGREAGLAIGYIGLVISGIAVIASIRTGVVHYPLEPVLLIPLVVKMHRLEARWNET